MGASSDLYLLNYDVQVDCIAPAVNRLFVDGVPGPWLKYLWEWRESRCAPSVRRPFPTLPARQSDSWTLYLDGDLSEIYGASDADGFPCWHGNRDETGHELQEFVEWLLVRYCVEDHWHFGNHVPLDLTWSSYCEFTPHWLPAAERLRLLIDHLSQRGRHWNHGSGGFSEGIHGWLRPHETTELTALLSDLPLPACEPTWDDLKEWRRVNSWTPEVAQYQGAYYAVYLVYLRVTAAIAARSGRGLLYGNDIYPAPWRQPLPPLDSDWLSRCDRLALRVARSIRQELTFGDLPILADALEEVGCTNEDMLLHCREGLPHKKTCWVVDWLELGSPPQRNITTIVGAVNSP